MAYPATSLYPQTTGLYPGDGTEIAPTVTTGAASPIGTTSATISGIVDPNDLQTHYWFEWGLLPHIYGVGLPNEHYSFQTPETNIGNGSSPVSVSANLTNLATGRTYYYRLVARNGAGFSWGDESQFPSEVDDLGELLLGAVTEAGRGQ